MGDIYKTKFGKEDSTSMAYIKSKVMNILQIN